MVEPVKHRRKVLRPKDELTPELEIFCVEYAKRPNATDAYFVAYPEQSSRWTRKSVTQTACKLLKRDVIIERISKLTEKVMNRNEGIVDRIMRERERIAFFDPRKLFNGDGTLKGIHELDDDTAAALESYSPAGMKGKLGGSFKTWDKDKALVALEKVNNLYKEEDKALSVFNITINLD